jgi:hypothetical protein
MQSSAPVSFFAWIAEAVKQRLPCQFGHHGVKVLKRAYHGQLNSVGHGHFEVGATLHSKYKGAGVHMDCMQVGKVGKTGGRVALNRVRGA